jgi:hypothetical protein
MADDLLKQMFQGLLRTAFDKPRDEEAERAKQLSPGEQVSYIMDAMPRLAERGYPGIASPVSTLLRRKLPFTPEQILQLVQLGANPSYYFPFSQVVRLAGTIPLTPPLEEALRQMRGAKVLVNSQVEGSRGILRTIDEMLQCRL